MVAEYFPTPGSNRRPRPWPRRRVPCPCLFRWTVTARPSRTEWGWPGYHRLTREDSMAAEMTGGHGVLLRQGLAPRRLLIPPRRETRPSCPPTTGLAWRCRSQARWKSRFGTPRTRAHCPSTGRPGQPRTPNPSDARRSLSLRSTASSCCASERSSATNHRATSSTDGQVHCIGPRWNLKATTTWPRGTLSAPSPCGRAGTLASRDRLGGRARPPTGLHTHAGHRPPGAGCR